MTTTTTLLVAARAAAAHEAASHARRVAAAAPWPAISCSRAHDAALDASAAAAADTAEAASATTVAAIPTIADRAAIATTPATPADYSTEFLDYVIAVRVVDSLDEAIATINRDSSNHSDAIVTADEPAARRFLAEIDSATVYWNASTRFTDGFEFGYGAEIGISTDRLHARGPMGLRELCTYKFVIEGTGQVRA